MEQFRLLESLSEKSAPGRFPSYTPAHLLYALIFLRSNKVGRKQLASELGVGEGTVRTILIRLLEKELITIERSGVSLSGSGLEFLDTINDKLIWADFPSSEITIGEFNYMVLIRGAADKVNLGIEQRDQALIHGAKGATTLVFRDGRWLMPGLESSVSDDVSDALQQYSPKNDDVAIIGSSGDSYTAALGAIAASFDLL